MSHLNCNFDIVKGTIIVEQFARWTVLAWILTFRVVCKPLRSVRLIKFFFIDFPLIKRMLMYFFFAEIPFSVVSRHDFASGGW